MDKKRWHTINTILDEILLLSPDQRIHFLESNFADQPVLLNDLLGLLEVEDESEAFWDQHITFSDQLLVDLSTTLHKRFTRQHQLPFTIDKFKAEELLGAGGMGMVYKARRIDGQFEQQVALKLLSPHLFTPAFNDQFMLERQILANLQHPYIARLYDGGLSPYGTPYLIMELIDGIPITDYITIHNPSTETRIRLLQKVCEAVHHAHLNRIIHCDLKPSNILIDESGNPHVLDFGIAMLTLESQRGVMDEESIRPLSLLYASPEQISNTRVDFSTDIYNLGLITYQVFSSRHLFDLSGMTRMEAVQKIARQEFSPEVFDRCNPELEAIIRKAIQQNPAERYSSAKELSDDLERFLNNEPLNARGHSFGYILNRFVARNKAITLILTCVVFLLSFLLVYHIYSLNKERDQALIAAEKARITSSFMSGIFKNADYSSDEALPVTSEKFLSDGVDYIRKELGQYPDVQARLLETVARIKHNLGDLKEAQSLYLEVLDLRKHLSEDDPDKILLASCHHNLGVIYRDLGLYDESIKQLNAALNMKHAKAYTDTLSVAKTMNELAWSWYIAGELNKAESLSETVQELYETMNLEYSTEYSDVLQTRAWVFFSKGNLEKADSLFRYNLELRKTLFHQDAPFADRKRIAQTLHSLGWVLYSKGALKEASEFTSEAVELRTLLFGRHHAETAWSLNNLGLIEQARGNLETAFNHIQEAYAIRSDVLGPSHPQTLQSLSNMAIIFYRRGNYPSAIHTFKEVHAQNLTMYKAPHQQLVTDLSNIGAALLAANRPVEGQQYLRKALEMGKKIYPEDHPVMVRLYSRIKSAK